MADQERSDVFPKIHCVLQLQTTLITLVFETSLESVSGTYKSNIKMIGEFEFHTSPNIKVSIAKDHGKNYITIRPPPCPPFLRNRL